MSRFDNMDHSKTFREQNSKQQSPNCRIIYLTPTTATMEGEDNLDDGEIVCGECGETPCDWLVYGTHVTEHGEAVHQGELPFIRNMTDAGRISRTQLRNRQSRYACYRHFTYLKHGHMGQGQRIKPTVCVGREVHHLYPDIEGNYRRFREATAGEEEDNNDDDENENEMEANKEEDHPVEYLLCPNVVLPDAKPITDEQIQNNRANVSTVY